jgi:hypothetical protein
MADDGPLRLNVTLTPKDLAKMNGEFCWRWTNFWPNIALVCAIFAAAALAIFAITVAEIEIGATVPAPVDFVLVMIAIFATTRIGQSLMLGRSSKESNSIFEPTAYEISDDGLRTKAPSSESLIRWQAFKEVVVAKNAVYLSLGLNRAAVIPRSAFSSPAAFDEFIDRCRREIGIDRRK